MKEESENSSHNHSNNNKQSDDINKAFEEILFAEEQAIIIGREQAQQQQQEQLQQQQQIIQQTDLQEQGQTFGYYKGTHLGAEIGYYMGVVCACITFSNDNIDYQSPKVKKLILSIKEQIDNFRSTNRPDADFEKSLTSIRNNFQHLCSLLKVKNFKYPQPNKSGMDFFNMDKIKYTLLVSKIDAVTYFLNKYLPLANCHMVEYITKNHWETLISNKIRSDIKRIGNDEAINIFWCMHESKNIPDADCHNLLEFIKDTREHSLKEDNVICHSVPQFKTKMHEMGCGDVEACKINEFMSPKKSHEVEVLSSLVASLSTWSNCSHIVDIGGGRGYLSTMLTLLYRLPVLNVDCSEVNEKSAALRNVRLQRLWPGIVKKANPSSNIFLNGAKELNYLYKHATEHINTHSDLISLIKNNYDVGEKNEDIKLCFTGLHTCGDLGSTVVRLFSKNNYSKILCAVPCCYHLISESNDVCENSVNGFPMSSYLKNYSIGKNARMLASQSIDRTTNSRQLPSKSLFYRALIEVLIKQQCGEKTVIEGKLKKIAEKCNSFSEYVYMSAKKLNLENELTILSTEYLNNFEKEHEEFRKNLDVFYFLRMSLAPIIESIILLDRMMFLFENGYGGLLGDSFIIKMFDPVISPRCYCLVSYKK